MSDKLSPYRHKLLMFMFCRGVNVDVDLSEMWEHMYAGNLSPSLKPIRDVQMHLGSTVSQINRRLEEYEIVPGEKKHTYRIRLKKNS